MSAGILSHGVGSGAFGLAGVVESSEDGAGAVDDGLDDVSLWGGEIEALGEAFFGADAGGWAGVGHAEALGFGEVGHRIEDPGGWWFGLR